MKTFKQYQKVYEERKNRAIIASPIHFKYVESRGQIPSAIHFKGTENLKESRGGNYEEWRDTDENGKLGRTSRTIVGKLTKGHSLTDDEKSGINKYTKVSKKLNKNLIDNVKLAPEHNKISSSIDSAIDRHPIQHGLHVYSGLGFDPTDHTDEKGRMHSPAYISATHTKDVADSFTFKHRDVFHIARISLQPGDPAIHVSPYSNSPHEDETIIKRGVTLQHNGHQDYVDEKGQRHRIHNLSIAR
jgi:hypothetical protein